MGFLLKFLRLAAICLNALQWDEEEAGIAPIRGKSGLHYARSPTRVPRPCWQSWDLMVLQFEALLQVLQHRGVTSGPWGRSAPGPAEGCILQREPREPPASESQSGLRVGLRVSTRPRSCWEQPGNSTGHRNVCWKVSRAAEVM